MSLLAAPVLVPQGLECAPLPCLRAVMRRLGVSLAVACGIPALLFYVTIQGAGLTAAVLTALAWAYGALAWRRLTGRPASGLLLLAATVLTVRTVFVLSTGNAFVYFLQPIVSDGLVGLLFVCSLATARPLVARVACDFYPLSPELAADGRVRRLFRRLTLMWGVIGVIKAGLGFWLLTSLSIENFVLFKAGVMMTLTVVGVAITIRAAVRVLRHVTHERAAATSTA